jgi:hypothetical protein
VLECAGYGGRYECLCIVILDPPAKVAEQLKVVALGKSHKQGPPHPVTLAQLPGYEQGEEEKQQVLDKALYPQDEWKWQNPGTAVIGEV